MINNIYYGMVIRLRELDHGKTARQIEYMDTFKLSWKVLKTHKPVTIQF